MAILKGRILNVPTSPSDGFGIHWGHLDFRDPDVLTVLVDKLPADGKRAATIPGVLYPPDESEAWTFDLDAVREEAPPTLARGIPSWASGSVRVEPTPEGSVWRFDITPQLLDR
jgi:hypothetical protein